MTLTKQGVREVVETYIRAWEQQDPELITTIFTESAAYHERVLEEPIRNRSGIRSYWKTKVVESQANISCTPLAIYLDGDTAIVEWEAYFDDLAEGNRKRMREVAILEFRGQLIASLREYWASEELQVLPIPERVLTFPQRNDKCVIIRCVRVWPKSYYFGPSPFRVCALRSRVVCSDQKGCAFLAAVVEEFVRQRPRDSVTLPTGMHHQFT